MVIKYRAAPPILAAEIDAIVTELAVVPTEVILPAYLIAALPVGIVMVKGVAPCLITSVTVSA